MHFFQEFVQPRKSWGWFYFIIVLLSVASWIPASIQSIHGLLWSIVALAGLATPYFLSAAQIDHLKAWPPFLRALFLAPICFVLVLTLGVASECRRPSVILDFLFLQNGAPVLWPHWIALWAGILIAKRQFPLPSRMGPVLETPQESERVIRSRTMISEEEAQERLNKATRWAKGLKVRFGVLELPESSATQHFMVLGATGSGKTTILQMLMASVIPHIKPGSNRRALIYDAKRDVLSFLSNFSVPVKILHPYDRRGVAWDIAADVRDDELIGEIADLFVPQQNQHQPIFSEGARALLAGVMQSLVELAPDQRSPAWTLRDVMLATRFRSRMEIICGASTGAKHLVEKYLGANEFSQNLQSQLDIALRRLGYVAAAWEEASEKVSLVDWSQKEFVLVMGSDPTREGTLQQLNNVILKKISQLLLKQEEVTSKPGSSWIFVDELIRAGKLEGLTTLVHEGRSKGVAVALGFQDIPGLYDLFGEQAGKSLISQCLNKLFLRAGDEITAKFGAGQLSEQEVERSRVSKNRGVSTGTNTSERTTSESWQESSGYSTSTEIAKRELALCGELLGLPKASWEGGIYGFYDCPDVGEPFEGFVTPELIAQTPKPRPNIANYQERKPGRLREWQQTDLDRLGLSKFPELLTSPDGKKSGSGWDFLNVT